MICIIDYMQLFLFFLNVDKKKSDMLTPYHHCLFFHRYDFIGKYETLADDSKYILDQIGAPPSLHFPEVVPSKTSAVVETYFDSLSAQQQKDLIRIYQDDFRIFDYHFRNFI